MINVLLVEQDPIFRLGLRVTLEDQPNIHVVAEAETDIQTLEVIAQLKQNDQNQLDLVILGLRSNFSTSQEQSLQLCQQLKKQYPQLPILLLDSISGQELILTAQSLGINGFCPKGIAVAELLTAIEAITSGADYWHSFTPSLPPPPPSAFTRLLNNVRLSGNRYIQVNLDQVKGQLQVPGLPILEKAVLAGKKRELVAARWLLNRILASPSIESIESISNPIDSPQNNFLAGSTPQSQTITQISNPLPISSPRALQSDLFASCIAQLQLPLQNVADVPLEMEILREDKKRELLYLILQKLAEVLDDLRNSQVENLDKLHNVILLDIWQNVTKEFFGKFTKISLGGNDVEMVNLFLQDAELVQSEILSYIPLFTDLLSYLIFKSELRIDNLVHPCDSTEAKSYALMLLENVLIRVANAVVQPLLNRLADIEIIKQNFYDSRYISTREIEKFRNNLSWNYRLRNYVKEPQAIFESRYDLLVFAPRGIAKISIYAPRRNELAQLTGIPLTVTLLFEFRDAVEPRLQSLASFFGKGVVFILTQVIGRGLGLIGRGILQGIGKVKS